VGLAALVASAVETAEPLLLERRHEVIVTVGEDLWIDGDPARLAQVVSNLLTNAAKYTEPGGRIEMQCRVIDKDVLIDVSDTGVGIPADKLDAIFEPFVQVDRAYVGQREGTGLGLSISRDLAWGMGGDLTVRSELGKGSVFTLRLRKG
jgi:signal transduction histidine kinase